MLKVYTTLVGTAGEVRLPKSPPDISSNPDFYCWMEIVEICMKNNLSMFTDDGTCILRAYRAPEGPMGTFWAL